MAASWAAFGRSRRSETATGSPSADTTIAWATPGVCLGEVADQPVEVAGFDTELRMAVLTLWRLATVEPLHAAGLRPRWSLGTYCRSHRDNMLGSLAWPADWTGPDHAQ
jgi:hypothetical protein